MTPHAAFLVDEPDSLGKDAFGHADNADALRSIVTDEKPPRTGGLFGPWGVGKSTIIGTLQKELEGNQEIAIVYFDAWRYEEDSLRRHFLLDSATDLSRGGRLAKTYDIEKELRELSTTRRRLESRWVGAGGGLYACCSSAQSSAPSR